MRLRAPRPVLLALLLILPGIWPALRAQVLPFEIYGLEEGLPQSQAVAVAQDQLGYIWVGTLGGLARFNGETFKTFTPRDGLPSAHVYDLLTSDDGFLFVATGGGLAVWDGSRLKPLQGTGLEGVRCSALARDGQGNLWVAAYRRGLWMRRGGRLPGVQVSRKRPSGCVWSFPHRRRALSPLPPSVFGMSPPKDRLLRSPVRPAFTMYFAVSPSFRTVSGLERLAQRLFLLQAGKWRSMADQVAGRFVYRLTMAPSGTFYVATK